jgi:hypothetical protein
MGPIRDLKGVKKVLGCLAALSRFISQLGEKGLPLYRLLKKHECFSWTVEAQEALDMLKATLAHTPILTPPQNGEPLQPPRWSARSLWWSERRKATPYQYQSEGRCTTSARCCLRPRRVVHRSRSYSTRWCLRGASCGTSSRPTRLRQSPHSRWGRSSTTRMPQAGLLNGL